jgi:hypothetical protein
VNPSIINVAWCFLSNNHRLCIRVSSQTFPIVRSALWGVVFCLDFCPFLFLLLFPCWMFFLYLFIYLFMRNYVVGKPEAVGPFVETTAALQCGRECLASSSGRHSNLSIWRCLWSSKAFFGLPLFYFSQSSPGKWETLQDSENWPSLLLSSLNLALGSISLSATPQRSECNAWKSCTGYMRIGVMSSLLFFPFFQ